MTIDADGKQHFKGWFRLHELRHTANQTLKDAGVDGKVRAALLGHASVAINEEIYTHASDEAKRAAVEKVRRKQG